MTSLGVALERVSQWAVVERSMRSRSTGPDLWETIDAATDWQEPSPPSARPPWSRPGTVEQAEFSSFSGNQVSVVDACGWTHYSIHFHHIAAGITTGVQVNANTIIGWSGAPVLRPTA